jgi:hypothetical protein
MTSASIIKHFDVTKETGPGLFPSLIRLTMHQLFREGRKKAFHRCIIPAIAFTIHATNHLLFRQTVLIAMGGIGCLGHCGEADRLADGVVEPPSQRLPSPDSVRVNATFASPPLNDS